MSRLHWVFGYGSLVWRPAFAYQRRAPAWIEGFERRFHQASTDHRGTPEAPGRVVTLERAPGVRCVGMAYAVAEADWEGVCATLDHRESGGYRRHEVSLHFLDGGHPAISALLYVATRGNPNYVGPASLDDIAAQVVRSHGPSGPNTEYVLRLEEALTELGADDPHVRELATRVRTLLYGSASCCRGRET